MNWTEGNLARHSRAKQNNNHILKRQKQHFTKARSRLFNGNVKKSPITISFLNPEHVQRSHRHSKDYPSSPTRSLAIPNRGLVQPSKQRPLSLDRGNVHVIRDNRHKRDQETLLASEGGPSVQNWNHCSLADIVNEEKAREKRRRLLMKPDWAGLEMQQPIDLSFPGHIQASSQRLWGKPNTTTPGPANKLEAAKCYNVRKLKDTRARQVSIPPSQVDRISPIRIHIGSQSITNGTDSDWQLMEDRTKLPVSATQRGVGASSAGSLRPRGRQPLDSTNYSLPGTDTSFRPVAAISQHHVFEDAGRHLYQHEQPKHVVYASSEIYEPTPRRTETSAILYRSPSLKSNSGESVHAEIGRPNRRNSSEVADSKRWLNSLGPLENLVIPLARGSSLLDSPPYRPEISPGISETSSKLDFNSIEKPKTSTVESSSLTAGNSPSHLRAAEIRDSTVSQAILPLPEDDENAAWIKFIFGTDDNDRNAYQDATHCAAEELKPSELSISSTELAEFDESSSISREMTSETPYESSNADSNKAVANSSIITESIQSSFRFALPRTFVGKLAESGVMPMEMPPPPVPEARAKGRHRIRGRRGSGKKMCGGRTNIRALPDFDGDPIEE